MPHSISKTTSIAQLASAFQEEFAFLESWEERYAYIIDMGKALPEMPSELKNDCTKVRGCASQVWISAHPSPNSTRHIIFQAESDAIIVSGLIAILLRLYSNHTADEILDFNVMGFFKNIGITEALSAQRTNGLASMVQQIHKTAEDFQAG